MAKSKTRKPSFDPPDAAQPKRAASWVYRSDTEGSPRGTGKAKSRAKPRRAAPQAASTSARTTARPTPQTPSVPAATMSKREKDAHLLVNRYTTYSAAAGLVPMPIVDMVTISGVQVAMLSALSELYGVPFSRDRGRALVAALLGGVMPTLAGHQILSTIAQRLTIVGTVFGMVSVSGFAVAATYAVGRVFIAHFESGGTLLDLDLSKSRDQVATHLGKAPQPS